MNFNCWLSLSLLISNLLNNCMTPLCTRLGRDAWRGVSGEGQRSLADCVFISCIHTNYKHKAISNYMMESPHTARPVEHKTRKITWKSKAGYRFDRVPAGN